MRKHQFNRSFNRTKDILEDTSCGYCPAPLEPQIAIDILTDYLLGENWYTPMSMNTKQVNVCILEQILSRYSKQWNRDKRMYIKSIKDKYSKR